MIKFVLLVITSLLVLISSCTINKNVEPKLPENIYGCWQHSQEEDNNLTFIFYKCESREFPASRFRNKIILNNDHSCSWMQLSPVDAHYMEKGAWNIVETIPLIKIDLLKDGKVYKQLIVKEVNEKTLILDKTSTL